MRLQIHMSRQMLGGLLIILSCISVVSAKPICTVQVGAAGDTFNTSDLSGLRTSGSATFSLETQRSLELQSNKNALGEIRDLNTVPGGILVTSTFGIFFYNEMDGSLRTLWKEALGLTIFSRNVANGVLIAKSTSEFFLFRPETKDFVTVPSVPIERITRAVESQGDLLISATNGLFRYNSAAQRIEKIADEGKLIGPARAGTVDYFGTANGVLRIGPGSGRLGVHPVGEIQSIQRIGGELFFMGPGGIFVSRTSVDPADNHQFVDRIYLPRSEIGRFIPLQKSIVFMIGGVWERYDTEQRTTEIIETPPIGGFTVVTRGSDAFLIGDKSIMIYEDKGKRFVEVYHAAAGSPALKPQNVAYEHGVFFHEGKELIFLDRSEGHVATKLGNVERIVGGNDYVFAFKDGLMWTLDFNERSFKPIELPRVGEVFTGDHIDDGILITGSNGLFWFDFPSHSLEMLYQGNAGRLFAKGKVTDGYLIGTTKGLFEAVTRPLSMGKFVVTNEAHVLEAARSLAPAILRFGINHECGPDFRRDEIAIYSRSSDNEKWNPFKISEFEHVMTPKGVRFSVEPFRLPPGKLMLRAEIKRNGVTYIAGDQINLDIPRVPWEWVIENWRYVAFILTVVLVLINISLFIAARYSDRAWRLATDPSWGTAILRMPLLGIRHSRIVQLWILDRYVRSQVATAQGEVPYLPVPLRASSMLSGSEATTLWPEALFEQLGKPARIWVQGRAGMGKTALFHSLVRRHFGKFGTTAFSLYKRERMILVPIVARQFSHLNEEKTADWVFACIKQTLSIRGLGFEDVGLLRAVLRAGTLGVAIDGIHEVARAPAVLSFAAEYPDVPILVTSQSFTEGPFQVCTLPSGIQEFVNELCILYLGRAAGTAVGTRLHTSGLIQHLRSGYDVRLIVELARKDPVGVPLPDDRLHLYEAVIAEAWPDGEPRRETLEAAAWHLIAEREAREDNRLRADDISADLLDILESASTRAGRWVRLVQKVPGANEGTYEFVHDQMHAYLAAHWFARRTDISAMRRLLADAKGLRDRGLEGQRTTWAFVAAMLDRSSIEALWIDAHAKETPWPMLAQALADRASAEHWPLTLPPETRELGLVA
jgi:hypothetical protein